MLCSIWLKLLAAVVETVSRTLTQLFPAETVTATCTQRSLTLTDTLRRSTETVTTNVTRTVTSGSTTLSSTVYRDTVTASCHTEPSSPPQADHVVFLIKNKRWSGRGIYGRGRYQPAPRATVAPKGMHALTISGCVAIRRARLTLLAERDVAQPAATTVTVVETTYTYKTTFTTIAPTPTSTETSKYRTLA